MDLKNTVLSPVAGPLMMIIKPLQDTVETYGLASIIGIAMASAHITILFRAHQISFAIAASLIWMAAAILLGDLGEVRSAASAEFPTPSGWKGGLALMGLAWCLLVLTFAARFYDPLLLLIPLVGTVAIALLNGAKLRSRTSRDLALIGILLPIQSLMMSLMPINLIVRFTTKLTCMYPFRGV